MMSDMYHANKGNGDDVQSILMWLNVNEMSKFFPSILTQFSLSTRNHRGVSQTPKKMS
jgi:hypothetical protein